MKRIFLILLLLASARADVAFDGVDDFIDCGSATALDDMQVGSFTWAAWVYPTSTATDEYGIITKGGGLAGRMLEIDVAATANMRVTFFNSRPSVNMAYVTANNSISVNTWQHVAVTFTPDVAHIYINGVEPSYVTATVGSGTYHTDAANTFKIGTQSTLSFLGTIADVRVYNRVLSANEILGLATSRLKYHSNENGLIAYWPLDDKADGTAGNAATYLDRKGTNNGTGDDGANNTGMTNAASKLLSYP